MWDGVSWTVANRAKVGVSLGRPKSGPTGSSRRQVSCRQHRTRVETGPGREKSLGRTVRIPPGGFNAESKMEFMQLVDPNTGRWGKVWLAAHWDRRLKKWDYVDVNLIEVCFFLAEPLCELGFVL